MTKTVKYTTRFCTHPVPLICLTIHSDKIEDTKCSYTLKVGMEGGKKPTNTKTCTQRTTKNILKATITPLIVIPHIYSRPMSHFACRNFRSIDASTWNYLKLNRTTSHLKHPNVHTRTHISLRPSNHPSFHSHFQSNTHTMHTQMIERRNTIHLSKDKAAFHPSRITFRNCECTNAMCMEDGRVDVGWWWWWGERTNKYNGSSKSWVRSMSYRKRPTEQEVEETSESEKDENSRKISSGDSVASCSKRNDSP